MNGFVSSSSSSHPKVKHKDTSPKRIMFLSERWDSGPMFEWYKEENTMRRIKKLQIRMDISGPVPHRFIIAYATNELGTDTSIYRFDRRPDSDPFAVVNAAIQDTDSGIAKDEYIPGVEASSFERTECEVELTFRDHVDLLEIIKACHGMSQDKEAMNYTLRRYNCFFFSWTILMFVARRHLPYEVPPSNDVLRRFLSHTPRLTDSIVAEAVTLFLGFVIDTIATFRRRDNTKLLAGLNRVERAVLRLPTGLIKFFWQKTFRFHLHLGMREQLKKHVGAQLEERAEILCPNMLVNHLTGEMLDSHLWLKDTSGEVRGALETELLKTLWDGILKAIAGDLNQALSEPDDSPQCLKFHIFGQKMAQITAAWNAALPAGLRAARDAACGIEFTGDMTHEKMFDRAWSAAREATLTAVKKVVARTRWQIKNKPKHDVMWDAVWEMWDDCWDIAHQSARPKAIEAIERVVEDIIGTAVGSVLESMQHSGSVTVQARVFVPGEKMGRLRLSDLEMTSAGLGQHMQSIIKSNTYGTLEDVTQTMGDIWQRIKGISHPDAPVFSSS